MITYFVPTGTSLQRFQAEGEAVSLPLSTLWVDLLTPTVAEDRATEALLGIEVPTPEEMQEIETSSRLYIENGAIYMTATLLCGIAEGRPGTTPVTFILAGDKLATVRYDEPKAFPLAAYRLQKANNTCNNGQAVLLNLLEAVVERAADILEHIAADIDVASRSVFEMGISDRRGAPDFHDVIRSIGRQGMLNNRVQESLMTLSRTLLFLNQHETDAGFTKVDRDSLKTMTRDLKSLSDHAAALDSKINFLLDAVLGLVNLDQSAIIKIFSVLAVVFMPPTLIASIYGMNFHDMPDLDWKYGYPFSLALMFISAIGTYLFFRWKRWL